MNRPRPDGLSSQEEFETLSDIEDALDHRMAADTNAVLAGRITGDGRREFHFYGSRPDDLAGLVSRELERWRGGRVERPDV